MNRIIFFLIFTALPIAGHAQQTSHKTSNEAVTKNQFLETDEITSMDALIKKLNGQKAYIDIWATTCAPCIQDFQYNEALKAVLDEKGYQKIYISGDQLKDKDKWLAGIETYKLEGTHLLASPVFTYDIAQNYSFMKGMFFMPQYYVIRADGSLESGMKVYPKNLESLKKIL